MHKGQLLKKMTKDSGVSVTWLTKKLRISRTTFYNHTREETLPDHLLIRYCQALGLNDSQLTDEIKKETPAAAAELSPKAALLLIHYWKQKHDALLEKWNALHKKQSSNKQNPL